MTDSHDNTKPRRALPRRDFLRAAGALSVVGAAASTPRAIAQAPGALVRAPRPRNVILLVADGMSLGALTVGDTFLRERDGRSAHLMQAMHRPGARSAILETSSADGLVTDSAAAASAWGIGQRVNNGAINWTVKGETPEPLGLAAKHAGLALGLVTTTRVTDATMSGFIANNVSREHEDEIAQQYLERAVDVALGGSASRFPQDLLARHPQYVVARSAGELTAVEASDAPLLGLFAWQKMAYEIERPANEPPLAEMCRVAVERLARNDRGFFAVLEGGRVDHTCHANDAGALVHDFVAFDDAFAWCAAWAAARGDTLVIATTDHGTANPGLATYGAKGTEQFRRLLGATRSLEWAHGQLARLPGDKRTGAALARFVHAATGIELTPDEVAALDRWVAGARVDPQADGNRELSPIGSVLSNHWGVAFNSCNHTGDHVSLVALGPGAETIPPTLHHVELHGVMEAALGL